MLPLVYAEAVVIPLLGSFYLLRQGRRGGAAVASAVASPGIVTGLATAAALAAKQLSRGANLWRRRASAGAWLRWLVSSVGLVALASAGYLGYVLWLGISDHRLDAYFVIERVNWHTQLSLIEPWTRLVGAPSILGGIAPRLPRSRG